MAITIIGLGPGDGRYITRQAWEILSTADVVYLRTNRHPAAADLPAQVKQISYDQVYESASTFEQVYQQIAADILAKGRAAKDEGRTIIYAVPGDPFVGEATVNAIISQAKEENLPVNVIPGISFIEPTLSALGYDGLNGLQLFDAVELTGYHFPPVSTDLPLLLGQVYDRFLASNVKLALMTVYPDEHEVWLVHGAGTDEINVERLPLYAIDRSESLAHLSSLFVPALAYVSNLSGLAETVAYLRSPNGCPWDQEQTRQSLRADFLEEVGEVLDALDSDNPEELCEEMGDLIYHLVMQTQIATEQEEFRLTDVIANIDAKLKRRHPHIWGDWQVTDSQEVIRNWELLKKEENSGKNNDSILANIPVSLPALARAQKIQMIVKRVGFDWPDISGVRAKVLEEIEEVAETEDQLNLEGELGDLLFAVVNWARWLRVDAESALRSANRRFERRFRILEQLASERGFTLEKLGLDELDSLWEEAKGLSLAD